MLIFSRTIILIVSVLLAGITEGGPIGNLHSQTSTFFLPMGKKMRVVIGPEKSSSEYFNGEKPIKSVSVILSAAKIQTNDEDAKLIHLQAISESSEHMIHNDYKQTIIADVPPGYDYISFIRDPEATHSGTSSRAVDCFEARPIGDMKTILSKDSSLFVTRNNNGNLQVTDEVPSGYVSTFLVIPPKASHHVEISGPMLVHTARNSQRSDWQIVKFK